MLGGQMAGGGVGVAVKEELILVHCTLDMSHAVPTALRAFAPLYVETVEKWRKLCKDLSEGRTVSDDEIGLPKRPGDPSETKSIASPDGGAGGSSKGGDAGGLPRPGAGGGGFIKA